MIDYNQSQHQVLIQLIRKDNPGKVLLDQWLTFDNPEEITPTLDIPRNTKIYARSSQDSEYVGDKWFYYNRLDIQEMYFDGLVTAEHLTFDPGYANTTTGLADKISEAFGIRITPDMIVEEPLPMVIAGDIVNVLVTLNPLNKTFIGTFNVTLIRA